MGNPDFKQYIAQKHSSRVDLHKKLDASKEKTKPVDRLTDDNGYFTLLNFAQTGG